MSIAKTGMKNGIDEEKMQKIIGRAILDTGFRKQILDPESREHALADYKLSEEEIEHLGNIKLSREIERLFNQRTSPVLACGFMPRASDTAIG